ncbi:MAG: hypothetical protein AUG48_07010 [Actinobacteria bacterium 13_1_20CM_3_68_9]|nr:MAG: hypothetical protein AUG48_07010 [Actinobacteria bacterium 13_1_20CM_3_68_9]
MSELQQVLGSAQLKAQQVRGDVPGEVLKPGRCEVVSRLSGPQLVSILAELAPPAERPSAGGRRDLPEGGQSARIPRPQEVRRDVEAERMPAVVLSVVKNETITALEGILEGRQRRAARPAELLVGVAHEPERVVVEAEPDVKPVLLDPGASRLVAAARALAAEPPTGLVDGDREALAKLRSRSELKGRS